MKIISLEKPENGRLNILVTGGAGFIGSNLVDVLVSNGHKVIVYDNLSSGNMSNLKQVENRIQFVKGDIRDPDLLVKASEGCDLVFHMAAMVSVTQTVENPVLSSQINEMGTLNVLEACRRNKVKRFVFSSSSAVYGDTPGLPKDEKMPLKPMSPYAVQKITGENYAAVYQVLYGLETVCLRYFNVFGPRQDPSSPYSGVISIFMNRAAAQLPPVIYGDGEQTRDFVFVADVVGANILAAQKAGAAGRTVNIGAGRQTTINGLWELVCRINKIRLSAQYGLPRDGDIKASVACTKMANMLLNFYPIYSMERALEITNNWYQQQQRI